MKKRIDPPSTPEAKKERIEELRRIESAVLGQIDRNLALFDRSILTLSSAFLAVSVGFIADFGEPASNPYSWALYASWVLFGCAIVWALGGALVANHQIFARFQRIEKYMLEGGELEPVSERGNLILNVPTMIFFLSAVILTIYFAICTLHCAPV